MKEVECMLVALRIPGKDTSCLRAGVKGGWETCPYFEGEAEAVFEYPEKVLDICERAKIFIRNPILQA
ncbi:hypothetical protein ACFLZ1_03170 [Patescibacteria group bacterium]